MSDQIPYSPPPSVEAAGPSGLTTLEKADLIRGVEVFSQATVEELYRLGSIAKVVGFPAEAVILRQNDAATAFYIVVRGQVELITQGSGVHEVVGPGQPVGLYSVLTQEPSSARVIALEDTVAIGIGAEDFFGLLSNNMEIVASTFKYFAKKLGLGRRT